MEGGAGEGGGDWPCHTKVPANYIQILSLSLTTGRVLTGVLPRIWRRGTLVGHADSLRFQLKPGGDKRPSWDFVF